MKLILFGICLLGNLIALGLAQEFVPDDEPTEGLFVGTRLNLPEVGTRASSTYRNCNCQCDSYTWETSYRGRKYLMGNCQSKTKVPGPSGSTAKFCYISGNSLCHCRDVLQSKSQVDSFGNLRYYSFEACTTPPRNNCQSFGLQNLGDGDFPYCDNGSDDICTNLYQQLDDNGCVDYGGINARVAAPEDSAKKSTTEKPFTFGRGNFGK